MALAVACPYREPHTYPYREPYAYPYVLPYAHPYREPYAYPYVLPYIQPGELFFFSHSSLLTSNLEFKSCVVPLHKTGIDYSQAYEETYR